MLLNRALSRDAASEHARARTLGSPSTATRAAPSLDSVAGRLSSRTRTPSPNPNLARDTARSGERAPSDTNANASGPGPSPSSGVTRGPSPDATRSRVPSRTQLRHASAARRLSLSIDGAGQDVLPDVYRLGVSVALEAKAEASSSGFKTRSRQRQRRADKAPPYPAPVSPVKPPPYLRDTADAVGLGLMADSANMESIHFLKASFMTPESVLDKIQQSDNFYHVWVAAMLAMEEMSIKQHFEKVLRLAFTKFLVELGSAIVDCLNADLPHYTFVDPRGIMDREGMKAMSRQAVAIVEGLEKKGLKRDRIYISMPATEGALSIARQLKEQHSIKTNLVFISGLAQAAACAAAGAAAITMPVGTILSYHEIKRGLDCSPLNPHPGRQNIKAAACYMKHHELDTQVIASGLRTLSEIEHCSALDSVCLEDSQVDAVRWHRMRVCRPPGPGSTAAMRAAQVPFPPLGVGAATQNGDDGHGDGDNARFGYLEAMSSETRKEVAAVLGGGLRAWADCCARIEDVIRAEMRRRASVCAAPLYKRVVLGDAVGYADEDHMREERRGRVAARGPPGLEPYRGTSVGRGTLAQPVTVGVPFPSAITSTSVREEQPSRPAVPPSPHWIDLDTFDDIDSNSSDGESDMVVF
ncbi:hypothetical protein M0805_004331 [Coniferiporia weirii]|nr:hypothetical protein M0805_004331 [Coniferiporia weirii]